MNVDFVIMGHNTRNKYIDALGDQLLQQTDIVLSVIDYQNQGAWAIAKESWSSINPDSDYGLVIQDDAILCDDFTSKAEAFLDEHNGQVCSFYYGADRPKKWVQPDHFDAPLYHAVALAIPTGQIPDMITYCDQSEAIGDDMKIRRWLISQNRTCRYSNPSLVQHRDIPSIVNPDKPTRQSAIYQQ